MLEPLSKISVGSVLCVFNVTVSYYMQLQNFLEARPIVTAQGPFLTAADATMKDMVEEGALEGLSIIIN